MKPRPEGSPPRPGKGLADGAGPERFSLSVGVSVPGPVYVGVGGGTPQTPPNKLGGGSGGRALARGSRVWACVGLCVRARAGAGEGGRDSPQGASRLPAALAESRPGPRAQIKEPDVTPARAPGQARASPPFRPRRKEKVQGVFLQPGPKVTRTNQLQRGCFRRSYTFQHPLSDEGPGGVLGFFVGIRHGNSPK